MFDDPKSDLSLKTVRLQILIVLLLFNNSFSLYVFNVLFGLGWCRNGTIGDNSRLYNIQIFTKQTKKNKVFLKRETITLQKFLLYFSLSFLFLYLLKVWKC